MKRQTRRLEEYVSKTKFCMVEKILFCKNSFWVFIYLSILFKDIYKNETEPTIFMYA